jgi:DNA-binding transcriptional MerR regulator
MGGIRTNAAAVMLGVSPNTLRSWERRYGFPHPLRSPGGHRLFELGEVEALRCALEETRNVSSAIALARERGSGPSSPMRLTAAFAAFDEEAANRLLEESLAVRSCERTVEEVLLRALTTLRTGDSTVSAEYEFAWRHAAGWLSAQRRLAPPSRRAESVLLLDATGPGDLDALFSQALELGLRRAGLRTLCLGAAVEVGRLGRALRAIEPDALVLSGQRLSLDGIARIVYAVRNVVPGVTVFDFRGAIPSTGASTVQRLGEQPVQATGRLLGALAEHPRGALAPPRRERTMALRAAGG